VKYHRHSFTRTYEKLLEWRSLPHVRFGVTWNTVADKASTPDSGPSFFTFILIFAHSVAPATGGMVNPNLANSYTFRLYQKATAYEELLEWRSLPHVRFGVTWNTVADKASTDSVARMETKEIVLETDVPFLPPNPHVNHNLK
jgi:hypothetical protein